MKSCILALITIFVAGCSTMKNDLGYTPERGSEEFQRIEYRKGRDAAKADLRSGILGYEDVDGGEEEAWQVLWCYRNILKSRYGITYRVQAFSPGPIAYAAGYQSVMRPIIESRFGSEWDKKTYLEAKTFHKQYWSKVANDYRQEQWNGR